MCLSAMEDPAEGLWLGGQPGDHTMGYIPHYELKGGADTNHTVDVRTPSGIETTTNSVHD